MHERIRLPRTRVGERPRREPMARTPADAMLSLQRSVVNRAATDILARDPKENTAPKPPADQFRDAIKSKSWPAAAKALNEVPDRPRSSTRRPRSPMSCASSSRVGPSASSPARTSSSTRTGLVLQKQYPKFDYLP
jgi:hypothetical protein